MLLAGPATRLRGLEEYPSPVLPLVGPGRLGPAPGLWAQLLDNATDDPDFEWLMIDASYIDASYIDARYIKVHPHGAGARGGNQGHGPH